MQATTQTVNHPTVGRVPNGAIVERLAPSRLAQGSLKLQLRLADFITASRVAEAVNNHFAPGAGPIAHAENAGLVTVAVPADFSANATDFVAEMETLTVTIDRLARVVVNERTGTIVMGKDVRIGPVAILQGNLTVEIQTALEVSQPAPFAAGTTRGGPRDHRGGERGKGAQRGAETRRDGRGTGSRVVRHWGVGARCHRDPAGPARRGRARSRSGGDLMTPVSGASGLLGPALAQAQKPAEASPRVATAAQQFEALLIGQMLKSMHESGDGGWTGTDDDDAGAPAIELADEQLAQSMASHGGFGLARLVVSGLNARTAAGGQPPAETHPVQP